MNFPVEDEARVLCDLVKPDSEYVLMLSQVLPAGMLIAPVDGRRLGEALRLGRAFCLRLVFAIQFEI